jgi:putative ABC transport system ATP-binding protein
VPERFLSLDQASVGFGRGRARTQALREVSLAFRKSELTLVTGPSGSGKTTLLSLLGCLLSPDSGNVFLSGREVGRLGEAARTEVRRREIGYVFQSFRLFRALTAVENASIGPQIAGIAGARARAAQLLVELGLGDKLALKPDALSGGERQRVAIARALLKQPSVLLADEPTASLDSSSGRQICEILFALADRQHQPVVVVSHDPRWESFAHRVVELRDGQIVADRGPNR